MNDQHQKHLLLLTLAMVFISTSGTLGRYIAMPVEIIIWWRSALASVFLFAFCRFQNIGLKIKSRKEFMPFLLSSLFMGAHWITYFYSLKLSNVAIGLLSLFTFPIITTFIEPLFFKTKLDKIHILLGGMVLFGIYNLVPAFNIDDDYFIGILLGVFSALLYSIRNLIMKKTVKDYNGSMLMFYQVSILTIVLLPVLFFMDGSEIKTQYPYVLLLALLTTAIGHTLFIKSLKYFKVSTASIIASAQPIFGIIIAYIFLNEIPQDKTLIGGTIILATVIIESWRSKKSN